MRKLSIALFFLAASAFAAPQATTVILVRHAEKAAANTMANELKVANAARMSDDPPLSDAGVARAKELARVLGSIHLDAIYTTQYQRTRQTAAVVVNEKGIQPEAITAGDRYAENMAERILSKNSGQTVLVVSHSNTIPDILRSFGVFNPPSIPETEYDDLFVCTIMPGGESRLVTLRYGAAAR